MIAPRLERDEPRRSPSRRWRSAISCCLFLLLVPLIITPAGASTYARVCGVMKGIRGTFVKPITVASSARGRPIMAVIITDPDVPVGLKTRIVIIAGQHGDEPHPALSVAQLAARWAREPGFDQLRRKSTVLIIPDANPDGLSRGTRLSASGADLNRDWDNLLQPETRGIARAIGQWKPHLVIDEHEWGTTDGRRSNCVELGQPGGREGPLITLGRRIRCAIRSAPTFVAIDARPGP